MPSGTSPIDFLDVSIGLLSSARRAITSLHASHAEYHNLSVELEACEETHKEIVKIVQLWQSEDTTGIVSGFQNPILIRQVAYHAEKCQNVILEIAKELNCYKPRPWTLLDSVRWTKTGRPQIALLKKKLADHRDGLSFTFQVYQK